MVSRETARTPRQVFGAMLRYYRERAGVEGPVRGDSVDGDEGPVQDHVGDRGLVGLPRRLC